MPLDLSLRTVSPFVLAASRRVTDGRVFRDTTRTGRRGSSRTLVAHVASASSPDVGDRPARAGFIVGKAVGNSVVRHRVQRRLRHLVREQLDALPGGSTLVIRALPAAATASYASLEHDLAVSLARCSAPREGGA